MTSKKMAKLSFRLTEKQTITSMFSSYDSSY